MISRLCEPIESLSAPELAECLGLDSAEYRARTGQSSSSSLIGKIRQLNTDPNIKYRVVFQKLGIFGKKRVKGRKGRFGAKHGPNMVIFGFKKAFCID